MFHAAAGGVGLIACQWLKSLGATVIGTVSTEAKAELALAHGCSHVINYSHEDVAARVREITGVDAGLDRVIEVAFGANLATDLALLKPGGVIATYASDAVPEPAIPFWPMLAKDLTVRFVLVYAMSREAHDEAAAFVTDALSAGRFVHQVFRKFSMDEVAAAHEATESMSNVGKVLIDIG